MRKEIILAKNDRIAVIAPHPDDECLGASAVLLQAPEQTDIYVLTDGSHGSAKRYVEEEATVRKAQFEAEMAYLRPHGWYWLGIEDTKLDKHGEAADQIDFTGYTKIFLPWLGSLHPDHVAAAKMCIKAIQRQKPQAECYSYEINAPFSYPSHYIDITAMEERKRRLVRFHADQAGQEQITLALNAFRAAQMLRFPQYKYVECYLRIEDCP